MGCNYCDGSGFTEATSKRNYTECPDCLRQGKCPNCGRMLPKTRHCDHCGWDFEASLDMVIQAERDEYDKEEG